MGLSASYCHAFLMAWLLSAFVDQSVHVRRGDQSYDHSLTPSRTLCC